MTETNGDWLFRGRGIETSASIVPETAYNQRISRVAWPHEHVWAVRERELIDDVTLDRLRCQCCGDHQVTVTVPPTRYRNPHELLTPG